jgi:hypothetical protein
LATLASCYVEVIIAVAFGVTDPARVERLRAATLALRHEANSRRFFLQTIVATAPKDGCHRPFPGIRRAMAAADAIALDEVSERRQDGELDPDDVLGMFLCTPDEHGAPYAATLAWILERRPARSSGTGLDPANRGRHGMRRPGEGHRLLGSGSGGAAAGVPAQ